MVVNVIVEGEEYDWSTSRVGMAHREICPVCLGVVKRDKREVKGEAGEGSRDEGRADLKECDMKGGGMGERRVCKACR
jgi:hypothetical protein